MSIIDWFRPSTATDAVGLLKEDHDAFRDLLKRLNATTTRGRAIRQRLFDSFSRLLIAHEIIEEKIFYPTLAKHDEAEDIVEEGLQEHHACDLLLDELKGIPVNAEDWGPKVHVMGETIEHHMEEEEEKMFPLARKIFTSDQLDTLGARMAARRAELLSAPASAAQTRAAAKPTAAVAAKVKQRTERQRLDTLKRLNRSAAPDARVATRIDAGAVDRRCIACL